MRDHLKSSSVFVNQSGTTVATNYYLPYGGRRGGTFSPLSTKRFTGQYHEADLTSDEGLSYYGARWYDAKLGRFLSADTIVPGPTNPQAFNRYSYVINNPLRYVDPSGHSFAQIDPGTGGGRPPAPSSAGVVTCAGTGCFRPSSASVVTCAGMGCFRPARLRPPVFSQYPSAAFPRKPTAPVQQATTWQDDLITTTRRNLPAAKAITKKFWGCAIGSCATSMNNWTGSLDFGGMWAPVGLVARGTISVAVDHEGGLALVGTVGSGGSTPTVNVGIGVTGTNAPSVSKLAGTSVQFGGSADLGVGVFAEGILFRDSDTAELYGGLSVSAIGSFPDPLIGSVHGTVENSWVLGVNLIDVLFYPVEWAVSED